MIRRAGRRRGRRLRGIVLGAGVAVLCLGTALPGRAPAQDVEEPAPILSEPGAGRTVSPAPAELPEVIFPFPGIQLLLGSHQFSVHSDELDQTLGPGGIFSTACPSLFDSRSSYGKTLLATLVHVFERHVVLAYGDSVYFYGGLERLNPGEEASFRNVLESSGDVEIRVLQQSEIDELIKDATVITINNVGDLIYE